ncbi:hypothetical protein [Fusobacterium varium]|uniref:hypothetical protein n=1 Tax=Fusobacterium varium TaxID=856 RepID=UPI0030D7B8EA
MENEKKVFLILSSIFSLVFTIVMVFLEKKESKEKIDYASKFFSQMQRKSRKKSNKKFKNTTNFGKKRNKLSKSKINIKRKNKKKILRNHF